MPNKQVVVPGFFDDTLFGRDEWNCGRINERYKRIIQANLKYIKGKKVIDLGSHNGLWSWAALQSGAAYVLGVEGRQKVINSGLSEFSQFEASRYDFICDDVFDALSHIQKYKIPSFDTVFCLGIYYHVMDHYRLMQLMASLSPEVIIIDTGLISSDDLTITLGYDDTDEIANAIPKSSGKKDALVGFPSVGALKVIAESCGYDAEIIEWKKGEVRQIDNVKDYFNPGEKVKRRYTFRLVRQSH